MHKIRWFQFISICHLIFFYFPIFVLKHRAKYQAKAKGNMELQNIVYDGTNTNSWTKGTTSRAKVSNPSNNHPNSWQPTLMRPVNDANGTIPGASQKYYILDQDYVNAANLADT